MIFFRLPLFFYDKVGAQLTCPIAPSSPPFFFMGVGATLSFTFNRSLLV